MWIIVATVLVLYLLGFLFICYLNAEKRHGSPSNSDNNSVTTSHWNDTENLRPTPTYRNYLYRRLFSRLVSSNYHLDDDAQSSRNNSDPSRSGLFAYREQQLRQIHHEINEMSYLLGASQSQSDQQVQSVPLPIGRVSVVQPLARNSNYFNINSSPDRLTFIHQLMPPESSDGESGNNNGNPGGNNAYQSGSPSSESCHIVRERQRRLRHIRMELEGLSLQLSSGDDRCAAGSTPHGMTAISPLSGTTTFGNLESSSLFYFGGGRATTRLNGNSWSEDNDDLPGYESIVCLLDSQQREDDDDDDGVPQIESPPPSYSEAVHLYSFDESGKRRK